MSINDFRDKKVWAVVGSVHDKQKFANKIYHFMKDKGYKVYAVDPSGEEVDGDVSYTSLLALPEVPEAVDMVINPIKGMKFVDESNQLDIKYIWFQPGAESTQIIEKAVADGMEVIYNECVMVEFR